MRQSCWVCAQQNIAAAGEVNDNEHLHSTEYKISTRRVFSWLVKSARDVTFSSFYSSSGGKSRLSGG